MAHNAIILFFASKKNFCQNKSATKFLCAKTFSSKVVAISLSYLTVHRRIEGDVPIYLKLALKVTHPVRKRRFRQISLNSASAVRATNNVQLSLIGSQQCAFHRASDEPRALPLSPPKGSSKREFLHCGVAFKIFVAGTPTPSQRTTHCPRKRRGHCHVTSLTFGK